MELTKEYFDEQNKIIREQIMLSEKRLKADITDIEVSFRKELTNTEQSIKDYINDRLELFKVHFEQQINQLAKKSDLDSLRVKFVHFRLEIEGSVDNLKEQAGELSQEMRDFEQRVDLKLYAIAQDIDALNEKMDLVSARSKEDDNALAHSYVRLDNRVAVLEGNK